MTNKIDNFWQKNRAKQNPRVSDRQMPQRILDIINQQVEEFNARPEIVDTPSIPHTDDIPLNTSRWLKIPDVVCVFVDMKNSTALSASTHERGTARAYQLFTGTAVRIFDEFEAPYIDVKGDGVFALFNCDQVYRALAAAVSFKTFAQNVFTPLVQNLTHLEIGSHIGIDQKTVLVRKIGLRRQEGRTDRQNEVWAGKPVNMASKLASIGEAGELHISDRYYNRITNNYARLSCGCPSGTKSPLWTAKDVSADSRFDFDIAWKLGSCWCATHGTEYCNIIFNLDQNKE